MTAVRTRRSLAVALVLGLLLVGAPSKSSSGPSSAPPASAVVGGLPFSLSTVGCIGCIGAGVGYAVGGWTSLLTAAATQGSALAVSTCLYWCEEAIQW